MRSHAPIKNETIIANHALYVTKTMRKALLKKKELQNRYFKIRATENLKLFKRQRNFCSRLYKRERKKYFSNLDLNKTTDNRLFWKTVKPLLPDKGFNSTKMFLVAEGKTVMKIKKLKRLLTSILVLS